MTPELAQWITPAILILGFFYLDRRLRNVRSDLRQDIQELRDEIGGLRDRLRRLEERMARLEGTLDVLREFFVGSGRGTAA